MKKYLFASVAAATFMTVALLAADIDGKWVMEREGKNGKQTTTLTLTSSGGTLKGTLEGGGGRGGGGAPMPVEITDGKIDGSNVSFKVSRAGRGGGDPIVQEYKGTVSATELKLTVSGGGGGGGAKGGGPGGPGGPGGGAPGGPGGGGPGGPGGGKGGGGGEQVFTKVK